MAAVEFVGLAPAEEDWMRDAACKGLTHLFFPSSAERPQARERREAMARHVCATCAVSQSEDERHAAGYRLIAPIGVRARVS